MGLKAKKKICSKCGKETYIWSGGKCKGCAGQKGFQNKAKPTKAYKGITMPLHTALYYKTLGFEPTDFVPSEISSKKADDIHHIIRRGLIGEQADHPLNLMALTREEHYDYGDNKEALEMLIKIHLLYLRNKEVDVQELIDTLPDALKIIKDVWEGLLE